MRVGATPVDQTRQQVVTEVTQPCVALVGLGAQLPVQLVQDLDEDVRGVGDDLGRDGAAARLVRLVGEPGDAVVAADLDHAVVGGVVALR